jgi:hypothetical protein
MKIAMSADDILVFPQAVPATGADPGEYEAYEIVD